MRDTKVSFQHHHQQQTEGQDLSKFPNWCFPPTRVGYLGGRAGWSQAIRVPVLLQPLANRHARCHGAEEQNCVFLPQGRKKMGVEKVLQGRKLLCHPPLCCQPPPSFDTYQCQRGVAASRRRKGRLLFQHLVQIYPPRQLGRWGLRVDIDGIVEDVI